MRKDITDGRTKILYVAPESLTKKENTEFLRQIKISFFAIDEKPTYVLFNGAEGALTGIAIGAAGSGYRPIMDWRQVTFSFVAMDQIVNQAAKIHYMFGGQVTFPMMFRASVGGGGQVAAQHSQSPYSMFMNVAGLKMFLPSTPYGRQDFEGHKTKRVYALFGKTRALDRLATDPVVLELLDGVLGEYHLSAPTAIEIGPGEGNQPLHPDDAIYPIKRRLIFQ